MNIKPLDMTINRKRLRQLRPQEYVNLHAWVRRHAGVPTLCSECGGSPKHIDWANISGQYLRDVTDYRALCRSCHRNFDWEPRPKRAMCRRGHLYAEVGVAIRKLDNGLTTQRCRACKRIHKATYKARKRVLAI